MPGLRWMSLHPSLNNSWAIFFEGVPLPGDLRKTCMDLCRGCARNSILRTTSRLEYAVSMGPTMLSASNHIRRFLDAKCSRSSFPSVFNTAPALSAAPSSILMPFARIEVTKFWLQETVHDVQAALSYLEMMHSWVNAELSVGGTIARMKWGNDL